MAIKVVSNIDLQFNELQNIKIENRTTDPANPAVGQIWFNTTDGKYKFCPAADTSQVVETVSNAAATYQTIIGASGILKGAGSGSVSAATAGTDYAFATLAGAGAPTESSDTTVTGAAANTFYFDTTNSDLFIKSATTWVKITTDISGKQDTITASGILKGNGSGTITSATAGTDYGYPTLTGSSDPTTATVGAVGQNYLNTTSGVEFVCKAADTTTPSYTWVPVTVDISGKQDTITVDGIVKGNGSGTLSAATAGTDFGYIQLSGSSDPTTATAGAVGQHYVNTSSGNDFVCVGIVAGTDPDPDTYTWKPVVNATASKALVSDANGAVTASSVSATELGYLSGATSNIQDQLNTIPKYKFEVDGASCVVDDDATPTEINTAAITAIETAYTEASKTPAKYDAINVAITFDPSDVVKDAFYMYNGSEWVFQYYTTTGVQLASGSHAGLIQEKDAPDFSATETYAVGDVVTHSGTKYSCTTAVTVAGAWNDDNWSAYTDDITLVGGVGTVNQATKLRIARTIGLSGVTATGASFDGSGNATIEVTAVPTSLLDGQVSVANGGTGKSSITDGSLLIGNSSGGFDEIAVDSTVTASSDNLITSGAVSTALSSIPKVYTAVNDALTATSGVCTWTVTHNLGSSYVTASVREVSTGAVVLADITHTSTSVLTVKFNSASDISSGVYAITVIGGPTVS